MTDYRRSFILRFMDEWNPWLDETQVKHVPVWQAIVAYVVSIFAVIGAAWIFAVLILSLERAYG